VDSVSAHGHPPLIAFARRLRSHAGIYALSHFGVFLFGMVNVAVLTRLLPIEAFGRLAVYLLLAALLTTIYNLGSLQGVLISVFGTGGGEIEDMGLDEAEGAPVVANREKAMTTGVLLTVAIAALGTAVVFAAAPQLAGLLGVPGELGAVRLAALCGATGAVWRLVLNVPRLERRPVVYSSLGLTRPAFALGLGVAFVLLGFSVEGALAGIAVGTALAIPVAIALSRRNYALGLEPSIVPQVFRKGAFVVPIIAAMWIVTNVDLFLVNAYAPADAVGPYRVAMRLGAGVSYLVSAVSTAYLPLKRTPLYTAMSDEHGPSGFGSTLLSAFLFVCIWAILALTLLADLLIRVAPSSYADAAPLVPLIGLGMVACGVQLVIYRGAKFSNRRNWHIGMLGLASLIFVLAGLVLVPAFGGYGAAAAQIVAFTIGAVILLWVVQRSEHPLELEYGKLGRAVGVGLFCIALGQLLAPLAGQWRILVDFAILAAFPALLVLARAFPSEELRAFVDVPSPALPRPRGRRRSSAIAAKVERLDPADRQALSALVANGASAEEAARALSISEQEMLGRFVASLRELAPVRVRATNGAGTAGEADGVADDEPGAETTDGEEKEPKDPATLEAELASYLLSRRGVATRDELAERLCEDGVDPMDLDDLDSTLGRLRRIPRREWQRLAS
jgi:O-antigen/teichoic acid export membrane protein